MKIFLTATIVLLSSQSLLSQNTRVVEFGDTSDKDYVYKYNVIKTSPTSFIFGRIPLEYEREVADFFSIQVGAGVTFLSALSGLSSGWLSEFIEDGETDSDLDNSFKKGSIGTLLSISPRFWFDSDGVDGAYIAPVFRSSLYKNDIQKIEEGQSTIVRLPNSFDSENSKSFDMVVHYGYQDLSDIFTWEYFIGLGIRNETRTAQDVFRTNNGYRSRVEKTTGRSVLIELGLRVGFRI